MSLSQTARILAIAAVFSAAPAIAANQSYSTGPYYGSARMPYLGDPFQECRGRQSELELRACLSRLHDEARYDLEYVNDRLERLASSFQDEGVRAYHEEKLRGARTTWSAYLDYHCDFEGAMLGDDNTEVGLQSLACQIMMMRIQAYRLDTLAQNIDIEIVDTPGTDGPIADVRCEEGDFREWRVRCDARGNYFAETGTGGNTLRLERSVNGGFDLVLASSVHAIDTGRSINVRVDSNPTLDFRTTPGYAGPSERGGFVIDNSPAVDTLIGQMRQGGRVAVVFYDTAGQAQVANFSLYGVTSALEHLADRGRVYRRPAR